MNIPRRVTIVTLAEACGVTDGTVSRALRGDPRVRTETREKVMAAAKRLGYRPHLEARSLKQGHSGLLGVFCDSGTWVLYNDYFGRLLSGFAQAAEADGRRLLLSFPHVRPRDTNPWHDEVSLTGLADLSDGRVDAGVVVGGRPPKAEELAVLRGSGVPLVWLSPNEAVDGFPQLLSGAGARSEEAGRVLAKLGHRKVAYLGLFEDSAYNKVSFEGLAKGLGPKGSPISLELNHWAIADPDRLEPLLPKLLEQGATALVTSHVNQALVMAALAMARGLQIPRDLSLLSFGSDTAISRILGPRLSLLEADLDSEGRFAYQLLRDAQDGKGIRSREITWTLNTTGQTLAPPKA